MMLLDAKSMLLVHDYFMHFFYDVGSGIMGQREYRLLQAVGKVDKGSVEC